MANADIGLVGLGTMGAALALNLAESGFRVAVHNRTTSRIHSFVERAGQLGGKFVAAESHEDLLAALASPRIVLLMVPAGDAVDDQIAALAPSLSKDDLLIDGGNANFHDTRRRAGALNCRFLGLGVSGGEDGARHGPSLMAGGDRAGWDMVRPLLEAIAADHDDTPCADWFGEDGAGHFVKTVHNGIEYADMQMIAEIYGLMRDGAGADHDAIGDAFADWNAGPLRSYLIEITAAVARAADTRTGAPLLEVIEDTAGQKGTGRWTAIEAQLLGAPVPVIEAAVASRNVSAQKALRERIEGRFGPGARGFEPLNRDVLERALLAGKIIAYAQGFALLNAARAEYGWELSPAAVARVWRAGCIIRSDLLDPMAEALDAMPDEPLVLAPSFAERLDDGLPCLREVVGRAVAHGHSVPALASALIWLDGIRTHRGTANMIQGQRDYFGRHGFARLDDEGRDHHGPWAD